MRTLDTLIVPPSIAPAQGVTLFTGDPTKWVDDWAIAGLSTNDRKSITAQLLAAHATFWRTPPEPLHDCIAPMRQAFSGIAKILFMADLLTVEILNRELPLFVLEAAIAGYWWRMCSATDVRAEIFPGHFGYEDDWQEMNSRWYGLFAAEISEWHSKLLESEIERSVGPPNQPAQPRKTFPPETREPRLQEFIDAKGTTIAAVRRAAQVAKANMQQWRHGELPNESVMSERIEEVLSGKTPLD